jgi:hypothetical protein
MHIAPVQTAPPEAAPVPTAPLCRPSPCAPAIPPHATLLEHFFSKRHRFGVLLSTRKSYLENDENSVIPILSVYSPSPLRFPMEIQTWFLYTPKPWVPFTTFHSVTNFMNYLSEPTFSLFIFLQWVVVGGLGNKIRQTEASEPVSRIFYYTLPRTFYTQILADFFTKAGGFSFR